MKHPVYLTVGIIVIALVAVGEARGWWMTNPTEVRNVPRTVRDNPGSYRPHYTYIGSGVRRGK